MKRIINYIKRAITKRPLYSDEPIVLFKNGQIKHYYWSDFYNTVKGGYFDYNLSKKEIDGAVVVMFVPLKSAIADVKKCKEYGDWKFRNYNEKLTSMIKESK